MKEMLIMLGLTEREADAYLALYNFEEATATQLAKTTKEHRTNIYDSLNGLIKKGLIVYTIKNNVKFYKIADPAKLISYTEEKSKIANEIVPKLEKKLKSVEERPIVEVYEGKEGFKSILAKFLSVKKTIYGIGASEEWEERFKIYLEQFLRERKKRRIHAKLLYVKGIKPMKFSLNEYRFLPTEFSQPSTIAIFGDYVAVFMWTEPLVATLTRSKNLSKSFKKYFDLLWKIAKK